MNEPARRQAVVGLAVAGLLGALAAWLLLGAGLAAAHRLGAERRATIAAQSLTQLVSRAGGSGDGVRRVVAEVTAADPGIRTVRVILFESIRLEASTAAEDTGEHAAPRQLSRDEKPIYDQGQRLRSAVTSNREDQAAVKQEIEVDRLPDGSLELATPLELDGAVVGMVQLTTIVPPMPLPGPPLLPALLAFVLPVAILLAVVGLLPERRLVLSAVAVVLLVAAGLAYATLAAKTIARDREAVEHAVAEQMLGQARKATASLAVIGVEAGQLDPTAWDVDLFRKPFGLLTADGRVDRARLAESCAATISAWRSTLWTVGLGAVLVLLLFSSGLAARIWRVLVENASAYGYVAPAMVGMILLVFFPFCYGVALSFTGKTIYTMNKSIPQMWVGLANFREVLGDVAVAKKTELAKGFDRAVAGTTGCAAERDGEWRWVDCDASDALPATVVSRDGSLLAVEVVQEGAPRALTVAPPTPRYVVDYQNFYWTLYITVVWTVCNVAIGVSVGMVLALILNIKGFKLKRVYRVLLILPWAMPNYITALIFKGMFHQQFGVFNQLLQTVGIAPVSWFEKPFTSFLACLATNGWLSFPFMMVISLGALQSIPADLYEAARVDGAGRWQQFRHITLPSLKPALVPAVILSVVWTFNMFNIIYLVSAGEPAHSTEILITQAYKLAFEQYRIGYAAAYSTVIFLILLAYGTWQNRVTRATEGI